jgi:hypothetical protein
MIKPQPEKAAAVKEENNSPRPTSFSKLLNPVKNIS